MDNEIISSNGINMAADNPIEDPMDESAQPVGGGQEQVLKELLNKIRKCPTYSSLYDLEPLFNRNGLTMQVTTKNRMIACKIMENKPYCKNVIDDYMFIGALRDRDYEISDRVRECLTDFVINAASGPAVVENKQRNWQDDTRLYGDRISIAREDVNTVAQNVILG
ncbi:MAG: hypothetical protein GF411_14075 [Candidatus Lokiarchaeota archaeon]|nr:hypothetical protein [Candidatus Lokiarchaeota archaeon]